MALSRYDPFDDMLRWRDTMSQLMADRFSRGFFFGGESAFPLDIQESAEGYIIEAALPGVDPTQITATATGNTVTIRAHFGADESKAVRRNYLRQERVSGDVVRTFTLPGNIETDRITSEFASGVLTLRLPKSAVAKEHMIPIAVKEPAAIAPHHD